MKTRSCFNSSDFPCYTTSCLINQKSGARRRIKIWQEKLIKKYRAIFLNVTAIIFTGTVFLGGSYLFFIQLAEYGW